MNLLEELQHDESLRRREFPVVAGQVFMAHAGVAPLPRVAAEALRHFAERASHENQEGAWVWPLVRETRRRAATLLGCDSDEVALLGPTSLGLNLVAHGLPWQEGDEVLYYPGDYPANAYPWMKLRERGVKPVALRPERPGVITVETVARALTPRTRLAALASCHYLAGYRIDIPAIGKLLRERDVLFSLDAIQTLGAFPTPAAHVDFMSADSHKWMLGPAGAGIFYVRRERQDLLQPALLGAWNVVSPEFVTQDKMKWHAGSRRYEAGTLNLPGVLGMGASLELLLGIGVEAIARRLLDLRRRLIESLEPLGFIFLGPNEQPVPTAGGPSAIVSVRHPDADMQTLYVDLAKQHLVVSARCDREGTWWLRLSPHFYNTEAEIDRLLEALVQRLS